MENSDLLITDPINSNEYFNNILFWIPPVIEFRTHNITRTPLRIGAIVAERLFRGLRYEGNLFPLTPKNYSDIIRYGKLDIIIVESCQKSATGHWQQAQTTENQPMKELCKLLSLAYKNNIPCVYWLTEGQARLKTYKKMIPAFNTIFCADPVETELLQKEGIPASTLLPAIQPVLHNPFKGYHETISLSNQVIFDGLTDLLHFGNQLPFEGLDIFNVKIIDSINRISKEKIYSLIQKDRILGCMSSLDKLAILKYCTAAITFQKSLASPTTQSWMAIETSGCRVPIVHLGELEEHDIRKNLVLEAKNHKEFKLILSRLLEEPSYREQIAQQAWRKTHQQHTFTQRLKTIFQRIGISYPESVFPPATVITPTNRPEKINRVIETFKAQLYPAKELVIVYNGSKDKFLLVEDAVKQESELNIQLLAQPMENFAGACLNSGAHAANGEYCFRMDDDDYYSENYISDMMLHLNAVDADIFGKPPVNLYFEDDREIYFRKSSTPPLMQLPNLALSTGQMWLGGNTIAGKTKVFRQHGYVDTVFAAADSAFLVEASQQNLTFFSFDPNSVIASRREGDSHTWRKNNTLLKENSALIATGNIEDFKSSGSLSSHKPTRFSKKQHDTKPIILYLGPKSFREGIWQNRVQYILPDLFEPLLNQFSIHLLTTPVPAFARPGIEALRKYYNITFHEIPARKAHVDPYSYWIQGGKLCAEKVGADIVTNIFGAASFGYALTYVAKLLNIYSVIRVAGDEIASKVAIGYQEKNYFKNCTQYFIDRRKEMLGLSRANRIIVMSPWERERVIGQCANREDVRITIRGTDLELFKSSNIFTKNPVRRFLFIGRNSLEKGYDLIEEAAKILEKTHPQLKFLFAGNFKITKKGNRHYLGFIKTEKLPELYESVDAVILCSRTEGMPQVVLEAMAMGKPCILSRHLFETIITDGVEALLSDLNTDQLVKQILRLHKDISLANRLAEKARAYAEKHFSKDILRNAYKDVFLEILEGEVKNVSEVNNCCFF